MTREEYAQLRKCLDLTQHAWACVEDAMDEICEVADFEEEFGKLAELFMHTRAVWHAIADRRDAEAREAAKKTA